MMSKSKFVDILYRKNVLSIEEVMTLINL